MDNAYQWIIENGGLAGEDIYPYVSGNGTTGVCKKPKLKVKVVSSAPATLMPARLLWSGSTLFMLWIPLCLI